jgi:hypothetical protein
MKSSTDGRVACDSSDTQDATGSIFSDLIGLIARLQTSIAFSEQAMATVGVDEDVAGSSFVLDDVTPRYATANAALNACHAALGEALCHLLEARMLGISTQAARAA